MPMSSELDIERVLQRATEALETGKTQIYEISESARQEHEALQRELEQTKDKLREMIDNVDSLEIAYRKSRSRLAEVSRNFQRYKEEDIREAYDAATQLQLTLSINREQEANLRHRMNELQLRIRNIERTIERAVMLLSQMNVVLEYLTGDIGKVSQIVESAKNRYLLGLNIIIAQEEERRRIAREIHDGPAQSLANLIIRTDIAERMLDKGELAAVRQELGDLKKQIRSELEEVRKIISNLRPMELDDLGLAPTIFKLIKSFEENTKTRVKFEIKGRERRLNSALEVALFRIVQEALSNVAKHAQATYVAVELVFGLDSVRAKITDNGIGFDSTNWSRKVSGDGSSGFGLLGMKERLNLLEGTLEIDSNKDAGTMVLIEVPSNDSPKEETEDD